MADEPTGPQILDQLQKALGDDDQELGQALSKWRGYSCLFISGYQSANS